MVWKGEEWGMIMLAAYSDNGLVLGGGKWMYDIENQ